MADSYNYWDGEQNAQIQQGGSWGTDQDPRYLQQQVPTFMGNPLPQTGYNNLANQPAAQAEKLQNPMINNNSAGLGMLPSQQNLSTRSLIPEPAMTGQSNQADPRTMQAWNQASPNQQLAAMIGGGAPAGAQMTGKGGQQQQPPVNQVNEQILAAQPQQPSQYQGRMGQGFPTTWQPNQPPQGGMGQGFQTWQPNQPPNNPGKGGTGGQYTPPQNFGGQQIRPQQNTQGGGKGGTQQYQTPQPNQQPNNPGKGGSGNYQPPQRRQGYGKGG